MISVKHILCISIHQIFETQRTQKFTSVSRQWTRRCVLKSLVDWLNFDAGWMTMPPPTPPAAGRRVLRVCVPLFHHSPRCRLLLPARTYHLRCQIYYLNIINATLRIGRYFIVFYLVFLVFFISLSLCLFLTTKLNYSSCADYIIGTFSVIICLFFFYNV